MIGQQVNISPWGMLFPGLRERIIWDKAQVWDGRRWIETIPVERQRLADRVSFLTGWVNKRGLSLGGSPSTHAARSQAHCRPGPWSGALGANRQRLLSQLRLESPARSWTSLRQSTLALIGLGPGLTPSGDDFLTGLILCLWAVRHASPRIAEILRCVAGCVAGRWKAGTNPFGGSCLYAAVNGHAPGVIGSALHSIWSGSGDLEFALSRLTSVGSTSGADILLGIAAGVELAMPCLL
jgi:hypothetical protein